MFGYVALELWLGFKLSLLRSYLATAIAVWFVVSALVLFVNVDDAAKQPHFFRNRILASIGITELLQFLTNLFVLSLVAELLVYPVLAFWAMLAAFAATDDQYRAARKFANGLLALVGLGLIFFTIQQFYVNWAQIDWREVLRQFALPIWLTIGLLPFIYLLSLYANYERAFSGVDWAADDWRARWRAKLALLTKFHFKHRELHAFPWHKAQQVASARSLGAAREVVTDVQQFQRDAERAAMEEQERLQRYAGSDETDAEGRRLDRREFKETMSALRWLATCQMGWYRNENHKGRYRADLLEVLGKDFTLEGLPPDSGITMKVAKNGHTWFAWRRTVSGWCFAIGAAGPPPDQWEYDGPEAPHDLPGKDRRWGRRAFSNEANVNW